MWDPLERGSTPVGSRPSPTTRSERGTRHPGLVPLRPHGLARQAVHLLDTLGLPDAHVLGVSFRRSRPELALRNPHRVRRLILASTSCGLGGVPGTWWRSACSPRRCATTRPASRRRPHAGCTARSPIPTAGSCTSRSTLAGHDPRHVGLPEPALRDRGLDEPSVAATHRRTHARRHRRQGPHRPTL